MVESMCPLCSWVAVLMGRQLKIKKGVWRMNTELQPKHRPNVRRVKKSLNAVRAERVQQALDYYRVAGLREPGASVETVLSDLLSDLRHLCDRENLDLAGIDRMAHRNYLNEKFG